MAIEFDELDGANALISAIEALFPRWYVYRDLAEAVRVSDETKTKRIASLQEKVDELMEKLHPKSRVAYDQYYDYLAVVAGGIGEDVWDKEVRIFAPNISEAVRLIEEKIEDSSAAIISIEQVD